MTTSYLNDELTTVSVWLNGGETERARVRLVQLLRKNPSVAKAHYMLGQCFRRMGRPKEAIAALRRAIALENHPNAHYMLALCLEDTGDRDRAVLIYRHILEMAPHHERARRRLTALQPNIESVFRGNATQEVPRGGQPKMKFGDLGDDIDKGLYTEQKTPFVFQLQRASTFVITLVFFGVLLTVMGTQVLPVQDEIVAVMGAALALAFAIIAAGNVSRFKGD